MPILVDPKYEAFAQLLSCGSTYTEAAIRAGFKETAAKFTGSKLAKKPEIVARVTELQERSASSMCLTVGIDRAWVVKKLVENVERAMQAVPVLDNKGTPTGEYRYDGTVANQGLALIGRELGMFTGQQNADKAEKAAVPQWLQHQLSAAGSMNHSPLNADFTVISQADTRDSAPALEAENHIASPTKPSSYVT